MMSVKYIKHEVIPNTQIALLLNTTQPIKSAFKVCRMALFGGFLGGENTLGDASNSESNNDGNDTVANFTRNR